MKRFTEQLVKDLKLNVERDNRDELHKIFTIYQRLDKLEDGIIEYLNSVISQFSMQFKMLDKMPPECQEEADLPQLERFF